MNVERIKKDFIEDHVTLKIVITERTRKKIKMIESAIGGRSVLNKIIEDSVLKEIETNKFYKDLLDDYRENVKAHYKMKYFCRSRDKNDFEKFIKNLKESILFILNLYDGEIINELIFLQISLKIKSVLAYSVFNKEGVFINGIVCNNENYLNLEDIILKDDMNINIDFLIEGIKKELKLNIYIKDFKINDIKLRLK